MKPSPRLVRITQRLRASSQRRSLHLGVEQRVVVEAEMAADALAMLQDFRRVRIFLGRAMAGLFEQRHVDHRGGVALRAGIAVPVPGAAEIAALLDDAHILDAGLDQPRAGDQAREAAADEGEGDVVGLRFARREGRVGVVEIVGELVRDAGYIGRCRRRAGACRARPGIWPAKPLCRSWRAPPMSLIFCQFILRKPGRAARWVMGAGQPIMNLLSL